MNAHSIVPTPEDLAIRVYELERELSDVAYHVSGLLRLLKQTQLTGDRSAEKLADRAHLISQLKQWSDTYVSLGGSTR